MYTRDSAMPNFENFYVNGLLPLRQKGTRVL